ncbi:V0D/AC39 family V-type ATPase subunit [Faecalispora anaeroviscerum]|uniref:V0D/AC39 family V-type ATPase subunit n=1 Tax=Faecalispora anaeroviscerum TaxID=2991836 RepID=UPI0024B8D287|nr:V-type ATPase subunit [Faecalispora anaeroviscerum]
MLSQLSSNVVSAKARAMYGRRLNAQNYQEMLNCKSVTEIARYLAANTDYDKVLAGINDGEVHRGQLENRLKQKLLSDSASLCRYEISIRDALATYLLQRSEVEQILNALLLLNADMTKEYFFSMPAPLALHSHVDLVRLSGAETFDGVIAALAHTPYQALIEPFRPAYDNSFDFTAAENALYTYLYSQLYEMIEHQRLKGMKKDLKEIVDLYLDLNNFARVLRFKTYFQAGPDYIRSNLLPFGSLNKVEIEKMIQARDAGEVRSILAQTRIGKKTGKIQYNFADQLAERALYKTCRHSIHFSVHASVVMLSYIFYMQIELMDIINIVEGIRYHLPPEEIKKLLAFSDF